MKLFLKSYEPTYTEYMLNVQTIVQLSDRVFVVNDKYKVTLKETDSITVSKVMDSLFFDDKLRLYGVLVEIMQH